MRKSGEGSALMSCQLTFADEVLLHVVKQETDEVSEVSDGCGKGIGDDGRVRGRSQEERSRRNNIAEGRRRSRS
jgi:hypothetical protein